jgi:hypothetical protein
MKIDKKEDIKSLNRYLQKDLKDIKRQLAPEFLYYEYYKNKFYGYKLPKNKEDIYKNKNYKYFIKLSNFLQEKQIYRIKDFMKINKSLLPQKLSSSKAVVNYLYYTQKNKFLKLQEKNMCETLFKYVNSVDYDIIKYVNDKRILIKLKEDKRTIFLIALAIDYVNFKMLMRDLKFMKDKLILHKVFLYKRMLNKLKCKSKLINIIVKKHKA